MEGRCTLVEHQKPYTYQEGDLTVTRGSAWNGPGCHLGCGVLPYTDFIACVDLCMTPTAMALADVLLPAATYPERDGVRRGDDVQRGEAINKVVSIGECKSDQEIDLLLGKRLNPEAWPWESVEEMYGEVLKDAGLFGMWDVNIGKLIGYEPGRAGFGSNCKTLLCKVYKVEEGE